jgi:hypothetical protein
MATRTPLPVPLPVLKTLAPAAVLFFVYNLISGSLPAAAELAGFIGGLACGLVLGYGVSQQKPDVRRVAATITATALSIAVAALFLHGIADVRPELARLAAVEEKTAGEYRSAVNRFRTGRLSAEKLADLIEQTIVPELHMVSARLEAIEGVPPEHEPMMASAGEYLRLRNESWRLRAEALRSSSIPALRNAERSERAAQEALQRTTLVQSR